MATLGPPTTMPTARADIPLPVPPASARTRVGSLPTPVRYRVWSAFAAAALVGAAIAAWSTAAALDTRATRVRDRTGPVLVATQQLFSSLAEADAAAAAVQLSGRTEDREQRRFYEQALERSTAQVERVASLIGDDDRAHATLIDIAAQLTRYSGLVEQARAENRLGSSTANATLGIALDQMRNGIGTDVSQLTALTEKRFADDGDRDTVRLAITFAIVLLALAVLLAVQRFMTNRSRRVINIPALLATITVVTLGLWVAVAESRQHRDVRDARQSGYDAISVSARIQGTAYRAKATESLTLLRAGGASFADVETSAKAMASAPITAADVDAARRGGVVAFSGLLADATSLTDSARERAVAAELLARWQRYRDANAAIQKAAGVGDSATAAALATTDGSRAFNGFNLSVESLLQDNTDQFGRGLASAHDRLRGLRVAAVVLPLLALVLMLWGVQLRIREYK